MFMQTGLEEAFCSQWLSFYPPFVFRDLPVYKLSNSQSRKKDQREFECHGWSLGENS